MFDAMIIGESLSPEMKLANRGACDAKASLSRVFILSKCIHEIEFMNGGG